MKTLKEIGDAASVIAQALEGFDAADVEKAIAAAKALRGSTETIVQPTFVPVPYTVPHYAPPYTAPADPMPWPQVTCGTIGATTATTTTLLDTGTCTAAGVYPLTVTMNLGGAESATSGSVSGGKY